jgi:DNA-binding transcriptional MerR regulator
MLNEGKCAQDDRSPVGRSGDFLTGHQRKNDRLISIPKKLYFKIGEVSKITGLPSHVLRFWETEFGRIKPKRSPSGQRLYRRQDVELVLKIKELLYVKKYTIRGASKCLSTGRVPEPKMTQEDLLKDIRQELESIRDLVS